MGEYSKVLNVRVSDEMKAWAAGIGMNAVRDILGAAMLGNVHAVDPSVDANAEEVVTNPETVAQPAEAVYDKPSKRDRMTKVKRVKVVPVVIQAEEPHKPAIPVNLAEQVAAIAARKDAEKKAREGLSNVGRLLRQFRK